MKKKIIALNLIVAFVLILSSCNHNKKEEKTQEVKADVYECPMKCNNQTYEKAGTCPVCGMELEKVSKV